MFSSRALLPGLGKACPAAQAAGSQGTRTTRHQPQQSFFHQGALDVTLMRCFPMDFSHGIFHVPDSFSHGFSVFIFIIYSSHDLKIPISFSWDESITKV